MGGPINLRTDGVVTEAELNLLSGLTALAAELNLLSGLTVAVQDITFTFAAGASNHCSVTLQAVDADGEDVAESLIFAVWLSDAATGIGLAATPPDALAALTGSVDVGILTAATALLVQTKADGSYVLDINDAAGQVFYVAAEIPGCPNSGKVAVSRVTSAADFGT